MAVLGGNAALSVAFEHRVHRDELVGIVNVQVLGEAVDLHAAPCQGIGRRVLGVAVDGDHAVAREAPLQAQHRGVPMGGQRGEPSSFLGEGFICNGTSAPP